MAKTQELGEANESLHLLNSEIQAKINEIKKSKQDLAKSDNSLLMANEELAKTNESFVKVNKELASANKELAEINEQIKHHNMKQKEFINIASHELKNPTQSILSYSTLIRLHPERRDEMMDAIERNAVRLQKIISDILDISKIDNNMLMLSKERLNLTETILQVVEDTRNQVIRQKKNVNIIYDPMTPKRVDKEKDKDIVIEGDKERIAQVVSNILDNAVRFVKEGAVTVSIDTNSTFASDKDSDDDDGISLKEVTISIKDSGKGIDPEILPRLFSKFTFKEGTGGTGLGLYICKSIVESHGGRIWAENNEDEKGATFRFSLPVRQY
jgi:signal transduction histidine kinase